MLYDNSYGKLSRASLLITLKYHKYKQHVMLKLTAVNFIAEVATLVDAITAVATTDATTVVAQEVIIRTATYS